MTTYATLAARYADAFDSVAHGERAREAGRHLPFAALGELQAAGFGKVGVPEDAGGEGGGSETVLRLLMDLAARDVNTAHVWRSHLVFIATAMDQAPARRERWLRHIVDGDWAGSALAERAGGAAPGRAATLASRDEGGTWVVRGQKYYATGSAFATWTAATVGIEGADLVSRRNSKRAGGAVREPDRAVAVVRVRQPRVGIKDDWDGFGQRLTGTGTAVFDGVAVPPQDVLDRAPGSAEAVYEAAWFQLILLAVLAVIARAARRDAADAVAVRVRTFNTGLGLPFREDPLIQEAVGRIAAKAFTAEAAVLSAADALDAALADHEAGRTGSGAPEEVPASFTWAELAVEHAQVTVPELALGAAQELFLTGGASATSTAKGLDRHWRNAQTVATHNPIAFRARAIGDFWINGTVPEGLNAIGDAPAASAPLGADAPASGEAAR